MATPFATIDVADPTANKSAEPPEISPDALRQVDEVLGQTTPEERFETTFSAFLASDEGKQFGQDIRRARLKGERQRLNQPSDNFQSVALQAALGAEAAAPTGVKALGGGATLLGNVLGSETLKERGRRLSAGSNLQLAELAEASEGLNSGVAGTIAKEGVTSALLSAPSIPAAAMGGMAGAVTFGTLLSGGLSFEEAKDHFRHQGLSEDDAQRMAVLPGIVGGIATGLTTGIFGSTGVERLARPIGKSAFESAFRNIVNQAGLEGLEETSDEFLQWMNQKALVNPDLTTQDLAVQMAFALGLGAGLGGAVETPIQIAQRIKGNPHQIDADLEALRQRYGDQVFGPKGLGGPAFIRQGRRAFDDTPEFRERIARGTARGERARRRQRRERGERRAERERRRTQLLLPAPTDVPAAEVATEEHTKEIIGREEDLRSQQSPPLPSDVAPVAEPARTTKEQQAADAGVAKAAVDTTPDVNDHLAISNTPDAIAKRVSDHSFVAEDDVSVGGFSASTGQPVVIFNTETGDVIAGKFEGYRESRIEAASFGIDPVEAIIRPEQQVPSQVAEGRMANRSGTTDKVLRIHGWEVIGAPTVDEWRDAQVAAKVPRRTPPPPPPVPSGQLPGDFPITVENVLSKAAEFKPSTAFAGQSLTGAARELGLRLSTRDELAAIIDANNQVGAAAEEAREAGDTDSRIDLQRRRQFFREAIEAATNTASGGLQNQREGVAGQLTQEDLEAVRQEPEQVTPPRTAPVLEGVTDVPVQDIPEGTGSLLPPPKLGFEFRIRNPRSFNASSSEFRGLPKRLQTNATTRKLTNVDIGGFVVDGETGEPVPTFLSVGRAGGVQSLVVKVKEKTSAKLKSVGRIPLKPLIDGGLVEEWIPEGTVTVRGFHLSRRILSDPSQFVPVDEREKDFVLPGRELKQKGRRSFPMQGQSPDVVSFEDTAAGGSFAAAPGAALEDEQEVVAQIVEGEEATAAAAVQSSSLDTAEQRSDARLSAQFIQRLEDIEPELADSISDHDPEDDAFWLEALDQATELLTPLAPEGQNIRETLEEVFEGIRDTLRVDSTALASLRAKEVVPLSEVDPAILNQPASGRDDIAALVSAPNNGLSESTRDTALRFLEHMNPQYLEDMTFVIQPGRSTVAGANVEFGGTFSEALRLIKVSAGANTASGLAEEFAHSAATFLPESFRKQVATFRQQELETLRASPDASPRAVEFLEELDRQGGAITSAQFAQLPNAADLTNLYPLINDDEFFAQQLTSASQRARSNPTLSGMLDWARNFFDQLVLAFKKVFRGAQRTRDAFFDSVLTSLRNGDFEVTARGGVLSDINSRAPIATLALTREQVQQEFRFAQPDARTDLGTIFATTNTTLADNFTRVADEMSDEGFEMTPTVKRDVGLVNLNETNNAVRATFNVDPQTYQAAVRDLPTALAEVLKNNMLSGIRFYEHRLDKLRKKLSVLGERLRSQRFADLVTRAQTAQREIFDNEALRLSVRTQIDTGIAAALNATRRDGASEAEIEQAMLDRRFWEHAGEVAAGVEQKAEQMIEAMEGDNDGAAMLMSPEIFEAGDVAAVMQRVAPRLLEGGDRKIITDVALLWVARNTKHRAELLAQSYSNTDRISEAASGLAVRLAASLRAGDMSEVNRLLNFSGRVQSDLDRAAHLYRTANRRIAMALNRFDTLTTGVEFATRLTNDPQWLAFRQLVASDTGEIFVPDAWEKLGLPQHGASIEIPTPGGETFRVDFHSDDARWSQAQQSANEALNKIGEWLADSDNLQKPERRFWEAWFDFSTFVTQSSAVTQFGKNHVFNWFGVSSLVNRVAQIWEGLSRQIGARQIQPARIAMQTWVDSHLKFGQWEVNNGAAIRVGLFRAARSHADDLEATAAEFSDFAASNSVELVSDWYNRIGRELFARSQTPGVRINEGDLLPDCQCVITKEDIAILDLQSKATDEAHAIDTRANRTFLQGQTVESEWVPGVTIRRRPLRTGERLLFRRFNPVALEFSRRYAELDRAKDAQKINDLLNAHFGEFIVPFLTDRSSDYSQRTGLDEIYADAAKQIRQGTIQTMEDLDSFVNERTTGDPDFGGATNMRREIRGMVMKIEKLAARPLEPDSQKIDSKLTESANSFTKGRGRRLGHYWFYNHGFQNSIDIINFRLNGSSRYFDEVVRAARSTVDALNVELASRSSALNEGRLDPRGGAPLNEATGRLRTRKRERAALRSGDDTIEYDELQSAASSLERFINDLEQTFRPGGRMSEDDIVFLNRLSNTAVGNVLTGVTTLIRNAFQGGFFYTGQRMSRLTNAGFRSYGWALGSFARQAINGLGGLAVDIPTAATKSLVRVPTGAGILWEGAKTSMSAAMRGRLGKAFKEALRAGLLAESSVLAGPIEELSNAGFQRSNVFRELRERGLDMPMAHQAHVDSMAESLSTWGQISKEGFEKRNQPFVNFVSKTGRGVLGLVDFQVQLFLRPFFPRFGDLMANVVAANSSISASNYLEAHLRRRYLNNKRRGIPNLLNELRPSDVIPSWFAGDIDKTRLNEINDWFGLAGIDLRGSINDYYARLDAADNPKEVRWLTRQQQVSLATIQMEEINVATPANRPLVARRSPFSRITMALMGWNMNTISRWFRAMGGAAQRNSTAAQVFVPASIGAFFLASLVGSALTNAGTEELIRIWYSIIGQERSTRQPWEREGAESVAKGFAIDAFSAMPFVATAVNVAINDLPTRRAFDPTILAQNQAVALADYVGGVINTGDISFGAGRLLRTFNPLIGQVLLNNLPQTQGTLEASNTSRLLVRYGPFDSLKPPSGITRVGPTATPLSPYGNRMLNHAMLGEFDELEETFREAVTVAETLGRKNPEQSARQIFSTRNPYTRAFKGKITAAQRASMLARMRPDEREKVLRTEELLRRGGEIIGVNMTFATGQDVDVKQLAGGLVQVRRARGGSSIDRRLASSRFRAARTRRSVRDL